MSAPECCACGHPLKLGALPIIVGEEHYCSVECFEAGRPGRGPVVVPEPLRSLHIAVETHGYGEKA